MSRADFKSVGLGLVVVLLTGGTAMVLPATAIDGYGWPIAQGPGGRLNPLTVPGTTVSVSDTPTGAAMTFRTGEAEVAGVRRRVQLMVERHNSGGGGGPMHRMMPASRASYEAVPDGARLIFAAEDPNQRGALRQSISDHAEWLRSRPAVPQP
jgi:hypothetical protein